MNLLLSSYSTSQPSAEPHTASPHAHTHTHPPTHVHTKTNYNSLLLSSITTHPHTDSHLCPLNARTYTCTHKHGQAYTHLSPQKLSRNLFLTRAFLQQVTIFVSLQFCHPEDTPGNCENSENRLPKRKIVRTGGYEIDIHGLRKQRKRQGEERKSA